jgi:predicted Zn finger-like uncharacterized protein
MALATQCPHCHTIFKVANDQLKLRAGLVRCGVCKAVFNGADCLVPTGRSDQPDAPASDSAAPAQSPSVAPPEPDARSDAVSVSGVEAPSVSTTAASESTEHSQSEAPVNREVGDTEFDALADAGMAKPLPASPPVQGQGGSDPLLRMTLLDIAQAGKPLPDQAAPFSPGKAVPDVEDTIDQSSDGLTARIDELNSRPVSGSQAWPQNDDEDRAIDPDLPEPEFLARARRQPRVTAVMQVGVVLLLLLLVLQASYLMRNRIYAMFPQSESALAAFCGLLDCAVGLPADIDAVVLEASELQQAAGTANFFTLSLSLRNKSSTAQSWPHIELTLNDSADRPLVRRVFAPEAYVASAQQRQEGLAPQSEEAFKIFFELSGPKASGYKLYLFYP